MEAIEQVIERWAAAQFADKQAQISAAGGGGGGAAARRGGGGGGGGGIGAGGMGMSAMGVIGIMAIVYMAIDAHIKRERARQMSTASTVAVSGGRMTGEAVGGAGLSSLDARQIRRQLVQRLEVWRQVIGGALDFLPEVGLKVRRDGEQFQALVGDTVVGTFDTFEDALSQGLQAALSRAVISGIGANVEQALKGLASAPTEEAAQELITIARALDDVAKSDFAKALDAGATAWEILMEKVIASGLSIADAVELRNKEIRLIRDDLRAAIEGLIPGTSGAVQRFIELRQQQDDLNAALVAEAALRERVANKIEASGQRIERATQTGGGSSGGPAQGVGGNISNVVAFSAAVGEAGDRGAAAAGQIGGAANAFDRAAGSAQRAGEATERATGAYHERRERDRAALRGLNQDLDAAIESLEEIPDAIPQELLDRAALATMAGEVQGLLGTLAEMGLIQRNSAMAQKAEAELRRLEAISQIANIRLMIQAVGTLGLVTEAWLDEMEEAVTNLPTGAFRRGGGGGGGGRREQRADFMAELARLQALAGGAAGELIDLNQRIADIIDRADEARRLGVAAETIREFVAAALEVERLDFMADFEERLRQQGETAEETALRHIEEARAAALDQAAAIAQAIADAGGGQFARVLSEMAETINAVFDAEAAEVAAEAAREEAEARREAQEATAEQIAALVAQGNQVGAWVMRLRELGQQQIDLIEQAAEAYGEGSAEYEEAAAAIRRATGQLVEQAALDMMRDLSGWLDQLGVAMDPEIAAILARVQFEVARAQFLAALSSEEYRAVLEAVGIDAKEVALFIAGINFDDLERQAGRAVRSTRQTSSSFNTMASRAVDDLQRLRAEIDKMIFGWTRTTDPIVSAFQGIALQLADVTKRYELAGGAVSDLADLEAAAMEARRRILEEYFDQVDARISSLAREDPRVSPVGRLELLQGDLQEVFAAVMGGDISRLGEFLELEAAVREQIGGIANVGIGQGADLIAGLDAMLLAIQEMGEGLDPSDVAIEDPAFVAMLASITAQTDDAAAYYASATTQRDAVIRGLSGVRAAVTSNANRTTALGDKLEAITATVQDQGFRDRLVAAEVRDEIETGNRGASLSFAKMTGSLDKIAANTEPKADFSGNAEF
jgi:hypothetical protein